jgi:HAD superfamily hydrolase (TIGR01509 family)
MTLDALVFDVDGTLADTEEGHRTAFNLAFERFSLGWRWERERYRALLAVHGGKERLAHYIDSLQLPESERQRLRARVPAIHAEKTRFYTSLAADGGIPLRSGVARLIEEARSEDLKLAIASTTTRANIDALLRAQWGARAATMFDATCCGDEAPRKKPAPDVFNLVLQQLGIDAANCAAFEDSAAGLAASRAAGLWTVVTPCYWTADDDFTGAGVLLAHLGDPHTPIHGEPGTRLRKAAWLTLEELRELAEGH